MKNKTIKIPKNLPAAVSHSRAERKALESWFMLKTVFNHGYFKMSRKELINLKDDLQVSYKTLERRLYLLKELKLVSISKNGVVKLKSYKALYRQYPTICTQTNYYVKTELHKKIKLENWFESTAIAEKHQECRSAFYGKIKQNHMKQILEERAINNDDNTSFSSAVLTANVLDYLVGGKTELSYIYDSARADFNVGYKRLSNMFALNSKGGMAYKKRKLVGLGLINVEKRTIEHKDKVHTTKASRTTSLGTVNYQPSSKNLRLTLPDAITFNSQKQIINLQK